MTVRLSRVTVVLTGEYVTFCTVTVVLTGGVVILGVSVELTGAVVILGVVLLR